MLEEVIVIWTLIVLEALHVEPTTVEEIIPRRVVNGLLLPIAAQVYNISRLIMV